MNLIIQVSDKHGERLQRLESGITKINFGRGWDNDVIIEDKYVDPHHFSLQVEDGVASLVEHTTTNGTQVDGRQLEGAACIYSFGEPILIGDTTVKIFDASQSVAPAVQRSPWFVWLQQFSATNRLLSLTLLAVLIALMVHWGFSTKPFTASSVMVEVFAVLLLIFGWSVVCSSVSKLVRRQSNFVNHWVIGCIAFIAVETLSLIVNVTRFNLQHQMLGEIIASLAYGLFGALLLYAVFSHTTTWRPRFRILWSAICVTG